MTSGAGPGTAQSVTVSDIMDEVACELAASQALAAEAGKTSDQRHFIATANLLLQVDESAGVTPNVSSITPYAVSGTNLTASLGAELTSTKQRTFSSTFVIDVSALNDPAAGGFDRKTACRAVTTPTSTTMTRASRGHGATRLEGDLGLEDIINAGVQSFDARRYVVDWAGKDGSLGASAKNMPSFGSTIQFTLRKSISSFGPTWTLRRFKGPSSGNAGLVNGFHTDTNKLVITFAPYYPTEGAQACETFTTGGMSVHAAHAALFKGEAPAADPMTPDAEQKEQKQVEAKNRAADTSRNLLNTMILQTALPSVPAH
jgi:hypothetical protein